MPQIGQHIASRLVELGLDVFYTVPGKLQSHAACPTVRVNVQTPCRPPQLVDAASGSGLASLHAIGAHKKNCSRFS